MSGKRLSDDLDPDYQDVVQPNKRLRSMQQDAKDATVRKIVTIIKDQFSQEIRNKEREIEVIDERIHQARGMLDRLRACIIASYYGGVGQKPNEPPDPNAANHPAIKKLIDRPKPAASANQAEESESSNQSAEASQEEKQPEEHDAGLPSLEEICDSVNKPDPAPAPPTQEPTSGSGFDFDRVLGRKVAGGPSRFCVKKRIIVGNVSKYITADKREENDQSTHKWMVYVRGPREAPRIDHFVKKVWFYLHPSYRPNDLVEISEPPFHLTRRGWGEFPVRVQLHFVDPRHKKVDIIHQLKLDRTYTGLQTLGAETLVDVELDRHLFDETGTPLYPDLSVLSSGLPAKAGAPPSSTGEELQASPVKHSTSTTAPSGGPCAELQATSSRVKASASAAKPSSSSSTELQATVKPSTSGAAPSSGSPTEVQATTSTAKASSSTASPPSSSGAEVQAAKPGTEKAEQESKPGASLVRRSPRAKSRQDTRKPSSPPEEISAKKPCKTSEADSLSKERVKPEETKHTNLKEEVEEKVLADAKTSKQKPVVMTTAIPSSSGTNVDSSKLKPVTMVTGGTVPISAVTIATSRAVSKTTAGSPKTFLGDQKEAPTLVVPVKVKAEPLSPPRVTPATVPTAREPVTFSRGVDTKGLVLPAQSKPLVGTAKPVKPGAVVGTVKPGATGGTVKPGAAGAPGVAAGTVKPGAAGAAGTAGGTTMVGTPPQGIVITKIVPTTSKPVTTVQQTLTLKPQGLTSKGVSTATQQNITIIKQVKQEAGMGVTMATQPSVVVTAGTGPKAVLTSPQKGTILKLSGLPGQSSSPVVGSGSHMIVGQSSAATVVSGSHMIVGQSSTSVVGSGSHMIVGQSSASAIGSGSHMIVGQSSASAIGSGSHMIVMSSQPSSSSTAQAVPRVVTSPPQGKAVLLSGVTPQMAQVPVKVEKMADGKVPVTPTKVGSASPTVPPGTPPQVRTISGAVIGGLSPVSKPHSGVAAGSIVQVAPQQLVTSPSVPGGSALVPPNVMNLPLVNVAPGAKVFLAAKSTDPAMKGKVILIPQTAIVKGIPLQQGQGSGVTVLQGSPVVQGVNMPAQVMGGTPQGGNIVHLVQGGGLASQGAGPTPTLTPQVTGQSQVRGERSSPGVAQTVKAGSTITLPLQPGTSYILMQQPQGGASASGNVPGSSPSRPTTLMVQQVPQEQPGKQQVQVVPQAQAAAQPGTKPMQSFRIIPSPQTGGQSPTTEPGAKAAPSVATAGGHTFIALTPQQLSQIGKPGSQQIGAGQTLLVPVQNMQMAAAGAPTAQLVTKSASTPTVLTPSPSHKGATPRETPSTPSKVTSSLQKSILQMKLGLGSQVTGSRVTGTSPTPTLDVIELVARKVCVSGLQTKEQLISAVVRHVPLVDSNRVISQHPYCAQSRQQFFGWNIGKQRAAEWQRAVTARKVIDKVRSSAKKLTLPTPTTREIMDWSRTHGYTPSAFNGPKEDDNYCELCGQKLRAKLRTAHEDCLKFWTANGPPSSCSGSADLCQMLEDSKPSQHADDNDLEVDVISLGQETKVVMKQEPMDEEDDHPRFFLPMSPAAEFVHDTAQKLGVKLEPVETTKDMFSPVLEKMVLKAALLFTNDVLRGALASAYRQNGLSTLRHAPPIILPSHIHQSVSSNPSCDFLSNSHMGVVAMEKEEPPAS
ncbi:YEATS domain-containing protein 2-like [Branchiostoma floridae]|uniref:YEATS domain-containing protein 2 n=1 Tax=Branchiostoma floridae TaxID=7739 RepID=A0A9J7HQC5_BRAFL|nr:YEATS domain-containing protein 2-like [Branchiostoma floridae]